MFLKEMVEAVEEVYHDLDRHLDLISQRTNMRCKHLCYQCCDKEDIEASPLEFFPLVAHLYESGEIDDFLKILDQNGESNYCTLFLRGAACEGKWSCLHYKYRGLVCRLFGYGYRMNRSDQPELVTCKILKELHPEKVKIALQFGIDMPESVPLFRNYAMRLFMIDAELSIERYPIKVAIKIAIEKLYFEYSYSSQFGLHD